MSLNTFDDTQDRTDVDRRRSSISEWFLGWPASVLIAAFCALQLALWIPHYLTWPWYIDLDDEAVFAHAWDEGIVPYRDIAIYQFPGQIYLFWGLGKLVGWGGTVPLYVADVGFLLALGLGLVFWSKRRLGRALPGLIGFLFFLHYYLSLDYRLVAQRDFQSGCLVVLGLFALQAFPGRPGRIIAALATAAAATYRPHTIFLVPALIAAIDESSRRPGESWRVSIRPVAEWAAVTAVGIVLAFSPLILRGLLWDLFSTACRVSSKIAQDRIEVIRIFLRHFYRTPKVNWATIPFCIALLALRSAPEGRRLAATWLLAWLGTGAYFLVAPEAHGYLLHPLVMVVSALVAVMLHFFLNERELTATIRLVIVIVVVSLVPPSLPTYCKIGATSRALADLVRWSIPPEDRPLGYPQLYSWNIDGELLSSYPWKDYRDLLVYLRTTTDSEDRILNLLSRHVAVAGPIGRLTILPFEGGVRWMAEVDPEAEARVASILEATPRTVIVWEPQGPLRNMVTFDRLRETILRLYEPSAKFGDLEVWRRKPSLGASGRLYIPEDPPRLVNSGTIPVGDRKLVSV